MNKTVCRLSLKSKLLLSYIGVFLIVAVTMMCFAISSTRQYIYKSNSATIQSMVDKACDNFDCKIEQYETPIAMCVYNSELQRIYKNDYGSTYQLYKKLHDTFLPFYQGIYLAYSDDIDILRLYSTTGLHKWSNYLSDSLPVESKSWFKNAMKRPGLHWNIDENNMFVTCRVDLLNRIGKDVPPMGVIYMSIKTDTIFERYVYINWETYQLTVRDTQGNRLYTRSNIASDCKEGLTTFSSSPSRIGWVLEFSVPDYTLHGNDTLTMPTSLGLILSGIAILIVFISIFTGSLLRGLDQLKQTMERVNDGELNVSIVSDVHDEIGSLTNTFDHMLATIRQLLDKTRENERRIAGMELKVLRAQIDPHFLYNTLSFINWKCLRAGQYEVSDIIVDLSTFYRTCLNKGNELTPVSTELANITAYINIQLCLHDNNFQVSYDIPDELMELRMLSFILQPFVENAIVHGIDKRRDGGGELVIRLRKEHDCLCFNIHDNDPGLSNKPDSTSSILPHSGYGIRNVNDRIVLQHGAPYGAILINSPEGGCTALLTLPVLSRQTY